MADAKRKKRIARFGTFLAVALLVGFVTFPLVSGFAAPFVPPTIQDPIGAQMVEATAAQSALCSGAEGRAALERLATRLAKASGSNERFKIYVADSAVINAFAAPGGYIVLYRAIIDTADSPDEVAGVLAHEMAHVVENHPAKGVVEALGYGVFGILIPGARADSSALAKTLLASAHSRDDELEADRVAVEMLNRAGLGSRGLLGFFATLDKGGATIPGALAFVSTHPSAASRSTQLESMVRDGEAPLSDQEWTAVRKICAETGSNAPIEVGG